MGSIGKAQLTGGVLAGGRSSRFGSNKAMQVFQGKTFLQRDIDLLEALCAEVMISSSKENAWNYYENGKIAVNKTTLVKYNGSWWYVENGKINFGKTTLCKYNGSWWFVKNGKVDFSAKTLCKYNGIWWFKM